MEPTPSDGWPGDATAGDGPSAAQWEDVHAEVMQFNREGLRLLHQCENESAYQMLKSGEELLTRAAEEGNIDGVDRKALGMAQAITASNLGIYFKRLRNYQLAMGYLQRALKTYESVGTDLRTLVAAHLNLCVCLLEAEVPDAALRHATVAIDLKSRFIAAAEVGEAGEDGQPLQTQPDDYATLAIAYHKVAECREALRQWPEATLAYTQAHEVVVRSLGPNHKLTKAFEQSTRCPSARPVAPEVPRSARRPATVDDGRRHPAAKLPGPAPPMTDFSRYKLDASIFPSWPPKGMSREEKQWYGMAAQHRSKLKASALARVAA